MKVTLDTNVVVSGFFWNVDSRSILLLVGMGALQNVISKQIFSEYEDVCFRKEVTDKTSKSEEDIKTVMEQTGADENRAKQAIQDNNGDLAAAIIELKSS